MKRKSRSLAAACLAASLLAATLPVRGDSRRDAYHPGGHVAIDGKSFLPALPGRDDISAIRRDLEKSGIGVPRDFADLAVAVGQDPAFPNGLVASEGTPAVSPPPLPGGLDADHTLSFETGNGAADIVVGKLQGRGPSVRKRLAADGWGEPAREASGGSVRLMEKRNGKGTTIVLLDEAEGTFLLLREAGR